ncbi:hypothetical protein F4678DRAFT_463020 [Xylaria arbuscula]|nr:hypothetical protein F4678DRAFT_463020 [Xylaria arbuscula]
MAKERSVKKEKAATKDTSRKPEKKVSDDRVTKPGKKKKHTAPPSDISDDGSDGGASVDVESSEDTPITGSSKSKEIKRKGKDKDRKGKRAKVEAEDDSAEGGAMLYSIDTNPTPINLTDVKTQEFEDELDELDDDDEGRGFGQGPKPTGPPSGLNRQARRRIKLVEREREIIKKKLRIPDICSKEQEEEVQYRVDKYIANLESKDEVRVKKKAVRKAKEQARMRTKRAKKRAARDLKQSEKAGISQSTF